MLLLFKDAMKNCSGSTFRLRRLRIRFRRASVPSEARPGGPREGEAFRMQEMRLQVSLQLISSWDFEPKETRL